MDEYTKKLVEALKIDYQVKLALWEESQKFFRQAINNYSYETISEAMKESEFWKEGYINEHYKPLERFF